MARKEKELHMQMHPGWSARDNYATHTKKKKKTKRDVTPQQQQQQLQQQQQQLTRAVAVLPALKVKDDPGQQPLQCRLARKYSQSSTLYRERRAAWRIQKKT